jgi:hypothetical protein
MRAISIPSRAVTKKEKNIARRLFLVWPAFEVSALVSS